MKRFTLLFVALLALGNSLLAQTNVTGSGTNLLGEVLGGSLTNFSGALYGVHAEGPKDWGWGAALFYNVTPATGVRVGPGLGIERLGGQWWGFSGTMQFQVPTKPFAFLGGFLTNAVFTPQVLGGVSTSLSGAPGVDSVAAIYGAGGTFDFPLSSHFTLGAGALVNHWAGAGKFDGIHELVGVQVSYR